MEEKSRNCIENYFSFQLERFNKQEVKINIDETKCSLKIK